MNIAGRPIGPEEPMYLIAELSGNHHHDLDLAKRMVREAAAAGADAVKLQTYTPDTITIDCDRPEFQVGKGTLWEGRTLHDLYGEAYTPWEWHAGLFDEARKSGVAMFSSPFDTSAIELLEELGAPAYKIASFECVDLELVAAAAATGKPLIISTGMATAQEIDDAVEAARDAGCRDLALLRCNSSYPAPLDEMDLRTIADMRERWGVEVGLSDHTLGLEAPLAARVLGATILEKHFTLDRAVAGPDSAFSTQPDEWRAMTRMLRDIEQTLGDVRYGPSEHEQASLPFRRSLFVVADVRQGEPFTRQNVRSIRPGHGMAPKRLPDVLNRRAARDVERGTPLTDDLLQ